MLATTGFIWPQDDGYCDPTYDPRFRPWYVSAISGPKNVIIILDLSGSMGQVRGSATTCYNSDPSDRHSHGNNKGNSTTESGSDRTSNSEGLR